MAYCYHEKKIRGIKNYYKDDEIVYCLDCPDRNKCERREKCAICGDYYAHFVKSHDLFLCDKCEYELKSPSF